MNEKELLFYANMHYKIGASFKSVFSDGGVERKIGYFSTNQHIQWRIEKGKIFAYNGIETLPESGLQASPVIYKNGEWAPLIYNYEIY